MDYVVRVDQFYIAEFGASGAPSHVPGVEISATRRQGRGTGPQLMCEQ